jgi:hypothetical protein
MRTHAILCFTLLSAGLFRAQEVPYKTLSFEEATTGRHTMDEKGNSLKMLTALNVELDSFLCLESPQQILCPQTKKGRNRTAVLYRWDEPTQGWLKTSGNLRPHALGSHYYFVFSVQCRGLYALMQEPEVKGETLLELPRGFKAEKLVWWQDNLQMSARILPDSKTGKLRIPCGSISALARIEGTVIDARGQRHFLQTTAGMLRRKALLPFLPEPLALKANTNMLKPISSQPKDLTTLK